MAKKEVLMPPTWTLDLKPKPQQEGAYFKSRALLTGKSISTGRIRVCQHQSGSVGARLYFPYAVDEDAVTGTKLSLLHGVEQFA